MEEDGAHEDGNISHGMCEPCYEYFSAQWSGMNWDEYLNRFHQPVVLLNGDGRVVAFNEESRKILNNGDRGMVSGLPGGEVRECVYARLPEGCGKTLHSVACTIRIVTESTLSTGEIFENVPACLSRETGGVQFLISTNKLGSLTQIIVKNSDALGDGG